MERLRADEEFAKYGRKAGDGSHPRIARGEKSFDNV